MARPHEVLGVAPNATRDEVRTAFRRLAALHHPDRGGDAATFAQISQAHTTMLDKLAASGLFSDIFSDFAQRYRQA